MSIWFFQTLCLRHKQIHQIWEAGPWGWQAKKLRCWRESKSPCTSLPVGCQLADISFFSLKFWVPNACDTQNSGCIESPGAGEENIPKQSTKKYGKKKPKKYGKMIQNDWKCPKVPCFVHAPPGLGYTRVFSHSARSTMLQPAVTFDPSDASLAWPVGSVSPSCCS